MNICCSRKESTYTELRTRLQNYEHSNVERKQLEVEKLLAMHIRNRHGGNGKYHLNPKFVRFAETQDTLQDNVTKEA